MAEDNRNEVAGMAFALPAEEPGKVFITELLYNDDSIKEQLLYAASQLYNVSEVNYLTPPDTVSAFRKGMAKVIDEDCCRAIHPDIPAFWGGKQACMTLMLD